MFETILSPVELGTLKLKNRIIFAPTSMAVSYTHLTLPTNSRV